MLRPAKSTNMTIVPKAAKARKFADPQNHRHQKVTRTLCCSGGRLSLLNLEGWGVAVPAAA